MKLHDFVIDFLIKVKKLIKSDFYVVNQANHNDWLQEGSGFNVNDVPKEENSLFLIMRRKDDSKYHKFKLFSKSMGGKPFFYFDSSGRAHYNKIDTIPLHERLVDTPHFNTIDENNVSIAYQTPFLEDPLNITKLNDLQFSCENFCNHASIKTNINTYPKISIPEKLIK